jgi:hypothetical protein
MLPAGLKNWAVERATTGKTMRCSGEELVQRRRPKTAGTTNSRGM